MHVGTTRAVPGAEAGGARVAVLGLGASGAQAADLTVGAVHHLHKLSAPVRERSTDALARPRLGTPVQAEGQALELQP